MSKRPWYRNLFLDVYIAMPLLRVQTVLFHENFEQDIFDVCRLRIELWKWQWDFRLYKRPSYE